MDTRKKPVYYVPDVEDCTLLQDSMLCYSGDNENYDQDNFNW